MVFRHCGSIEGAWYRRNPQKHSRAAAVQQLSRLAVMLLPRVGPSFPGQLAESHDHRLYHVAFAASTGVRHVLCTARGEVPRASRAILQALCTAPLSEHTALAHEATLRSTRKICGIRSNHTGSALAAPLRDKNSGDGSHSARQRRPERRHTFPTTCGASQGNASCARANIFRYASLVFRSDSSKPATNTSKIYCSVSQPWSRTLARSNSSTTGPHKPVTLTKSFQQSKV